MGIFQKPAIGLDISDHSIEAVFIVRSRDQLVVSSYGRTTLPPGVVVDGAVEKQEALSLSLRKLLLDQMTPPLPKGVSRVVFALPESQVYSHIFEVPRIADEAELGRSLAVEADGFFPYNHQELAAGYAVIGQRPDKKVVFYAAAHKDTLEGYLSLFDMTGLTPIAVESESSATARATLPAGSTDPVLYVDIGARVTDISIFDLNGIQFSETLETAGDAFTSALSRSLDISEEDADSLKRNKGLSNDLDLRAGKALRLEVDALARDVMDALAYYEGNSKRMISRIILCGGSTLMPGLVEYLSGKFAQPSRNIHVETADPWARLQLHPLLKKAGIHERGVLATTAVGLALRGLGVQTFAEIDFLAGGVPSGSKRLAADRNRAPKASGGGRRQPRGAPGSESRRFKLAAAIIGMLVLAASGWLIASKMRPARPKAAAVTSAPSSAIPLSVDIGLGQAFSADARTVAVAAVEVSKDFEKDVAHQATSSDGKAKGMVEIINESRADQPLVAGTRLLSAQGVLFRLDGRVTVPSGGRETVAVTADALGAAGDVPAGRFTIPGLPASAQKLIYGESQVAMIGGTAWSGDPFTQAELDAALAGLSQEQADAMYGLAVEQAGPDFVLPKASYDGVRTEILEAPSVGTPVGDFKLKVRFTASGMALPTDQLQLLLQDALRSQVPAGADVGDYDIRPTEYAVQPTADGSVIGVLKVSAEAVQRIGS